MSDDEKLCSLREEVEAQRNELRDTHQRARDLSAFAKRVMIAASSLVIVLGLDGRVRHTNLSCRQTKGWRNTGMPLNTMATS